MAQIKTAVIPAAGKGTRLAPFSNKVPKEMYPVVARPTIDYVVKEAVSAGVKDILFITSVGKTAIEDYFDGNEEFQNVTFHYTRQPKPRGLGDAVSYAKKHVAGEPFLLLLGDDITVGKETASQSLVNCYNKTGGSVVSVQHVAKEDVNKFGIIKPRKMIDDITYEVESLVEKPNPQSAPSDLAIVGKYILDAKIFDYIENVKPDQRGEIQLTDALDLYRKDNPLFARVFQGKRYDIGAKASAIIANIELGLMDDSTKETILRYLNSNEWKNV